MSEAKFTKGEWNAVIHNAPYIGRMVSVHGDFGGFEITNCDNAEANAHLIAAAPEMYEILESLLGTEIDSVDTHNKIVNLLAKARGETK